MASANRDAAKHNGRLKLAFQLLFHLPFWILVLIATQALQRAGQWQPGDASLKWATLVGLAVIGFGLVAGALGTSAGFLEDTEDAEDLRRERRALLLGAAALFCSGSSLIVLCLSGPGQLLPSRIGLPAVLLLTALAALFVRIRWLRLDELNRSVARDAGHLAFALFSWTAGTWAILAHLAYLPAPSPLHVLTLIHGCSFVAGILATARKGGFATLPERSA